MTLWQYIQLIFNITEKQNYEQNKFIIIHICSSHLIKTVIRKGKKCFPNKKKQWLQRQIIGILTSKLLHCDSVTSATKIYESLMQIFGLSKKVKNFDSIIRTVRSDESEREESDSDDDDLDDDNNNNDDNSKNKEVSDGLMEECALSEAEEKEATSATSNSPYWKIFQAIEIKILKESTCTDTENDFFSKNFIRYVADFLMPYFPLWSAINLTKVGLYRDSNAPVENHYKILKHYKFAHKKKIPAPRSIMQNFEFITGGIKERKFSLKTTRQMKKKSNVHDNPVES